MLAPLIKAVELPALRPALAVLLLASACVPSPAAQGTSVVAAWIARTKTRFRLALARLRLPRAEAQVAQ